MIIFWVFLLLFDTKAVQVIKKNPFVLYVCETWPVKLRDEHKFKMFENSEVRNAYESKEGEIIT